MKQKSTHLIGKFLYQLYQSNPEAADKIGQIILQQIKQSGYLFKEQLAKEGEIPAIRAVHQKVDQLVLEKLKDVKEPVSCRRGCAACCHIEVDINPFEAALIVNYCKKNKIAIDKEYLRWQRKHTKRQRLYSQQSACVFLINKECSIYPVRPIACRKYLVVSPPEHCDVKNGVREVSVVFLREVEIMLSGILRVVQDGKMADMLLEVMK